MLLAVTGSMRAWTGSGTAADPYLISNGTDWIMLVSEVRNGTTHNGKVFRLTADISIKTGVGTDDNAFMGIFDGNGHTITMIDSTGVHNMTAPFCHVQDATIRHLRTTGYYVAEKQYAAGIVSLVKGSGLTTIDDCQSSVEIVGIGISNAAHGGLVGAVATGTVLIDRGVFLGELNGENSAGMVGWSNTDLTIRNSFVSPQTRLFIKNGRTFARMAGDAKLTLEDCYYTADLSPNHEAPQGEGIFRQVLLPNGGTAEIQGEPDLRFAGQDYWKSGTWVKLTAPEGKPFDHWFTDMNGCFVSDPWLKDGLHQLQDIYGTPVLSVSTQTPAGEERTMDGTRYRYLKEADYHLYVSDEECRRRGWQLKDGYLMKYVQDKDAWAYITAVVGCVSGEIPADGLQIHNDLAGDWHDHTLMGLIAPGAFQGNNELKTLYFKDTDATHKNQLEKFNFFIGERAFADCPNLVEVKMMQYTTEGSNHWEYISPGQVSYVAPNAFDGSPSALVTCHRDVYQQYLSSQTWQNFLSRITIYDATVEDFTVRGVKYHQYRNKQETDLLTNRNKDQMLENHVRIWAADYKNFNPADLLAATDESQNIYYTSVVGADDTYLRENDGQVVILNDLGSYYNYKTICLGRSAFAGNENIKSIEFRQLDGDHTSRSNLKMVIQNGALKGCKNLHELRMFYWCEDGPDHWETLGPQDVIPGDNIFGKPSSDELLAAMKAGTTLESTVPEDFRILVAPDRYREFLEDPNWLPYMGYLEPVEYSPSTKQDFTVSGHGGITYGYMTNPGGIYQTSQTVSQDVSWWTAPRIAYEVVKTILALKSIAIDLEGSLAKSEAADDLLEQANRVLTATEGEIADCGEALTQLQTIGPAGLDADMITGIMPYRFKVLGASNEIMADLARNKLINNAGEWYASTAAMESFFEEWGDMGRLLLHDLFVETMNNRLEALGKDVVAQRIAYNVAEKAARKALKKYMFDEVLAVDPIHRKILTFMTNDLGFTRFLGNASTAVSTLGYMAAKQWGGTGGSVNGDMLRKGMRENIISNMHQVGIVGGGYVFTTPVKNISYHTYIKEVKDDVTSAVIYAGTDVGQGQNANTVTSAISPTAFRNKKNLKTVSFHENTVTTNEAVAMVLAIPDSAFVGCQNLTELRLLLETNGHGTQAMGPENFILAGDSIFAGLSPQKFHIVIDPSRKQDFLDSESWAPLEKYFSYETAAPKTEYNEYGAKYAYAYESATVQKVHKERGHKIEHTVVTGPTTDGKYKLADHMGALKLCNDIGSYNNYQLDAVKAGAFKGCKELKYVLFTDLMGSGAFGDCYTGLSVMLEDSCFASSGLDYLDMLYMVTDGDNHIDPITPQQVRIGQGVFDNTNAYIKMLPQQVEWFRADSAWAQYENRFLPCIIKPGDVGVRNALKKYAYWDKAATGYDTELWTDYIDLVRVMTFGFDELSGKFTAENENLRSFADFKYFECVKLDYVGDSWFEDCYRLGNIQLPSTIKRIGKRAFHSCTSLKGIELPALVNSIEDEAFDFCPNLTSVVVLGDTPARLGRSAFSTRHDLRIYVPTAKVSAYKQAWPDYAEYIVGMNELEVKKHVNVNTPGTLAQELGLSLDWDYSGIAAGDEPRYLQGEYSRYDSLTVSGTLNNIDLAVLRYMAGCDSYTRGGAATDGKLRYLNLKDANIKKDSGDKAHYFNRSHGLESEWYEIKEDNTVPDYLFYKCTALETVILPSSATKMGNFVFLGCTGLKRLALTGKLKEYATWENVIGELDSPLEELVFATDQLATSSDNDPWGQPLAQVYVKQSQLAGYMGQPYLTNQAQNVTAPFQDDGVMDALARAGEFFPSEYLKRENVDDIFSLYNGISHFDDFYLFQNVKELGNTFLYNDIESITLPASIKRISAQAFAFCWRLQTVRLSSQEVPELEEDAFKFHADNFQILVPKSLCKLYREKWPQYAEFINPDQKSYAEGDIIVVTTTAPNTLHEKLGLTVTYDKSIAMDYNYDRLSYINSVKGDYSKITRLKVVGPISGSDLALMRYLAGFCPWANTRNYMGHLEYIDLYDAELKASNHAHASDEIWDVRSYGNDKFVGHDNVLPPYAFLQAYNLKTLILPRTVTKIETRALQQCEGLETLVIGDETTDVNWSALDDCAMLSRLYLLSKQKPKLDMDSWMWRNLCNNYHPTFDAFYVRPSLYQDYLRDNAYTGDTWQRTNNISTGEFTEDESFCAFAAHAAATADDLMNVDNVNGWFSSHTAVRDLTPLRHTMIDSLAAETLQPLTKLERIAVPLTLEAIEKGAFKNAPNLRYIDFLQCGADGIVSKLQAGAFQNLGIDTLRTLVYLPAQYGSPAGTNIVVAGNAPAAEGSTVDKAALSLKAETFRLIDSLDYCVPYSFEAQKVENSRVLQKDTIPYTVCLPYTIDVPEYTKAYKLSERSGNTLVFTQLEEGQKMEAMQPYLLKVMGFKKLKITTATLNTSTPQTIPANGASTVGQQVDAPGYSMRGTLEAVLPQTAADMGAYILQSDGDWHPVSATAAESKASVLPFRAYLLPSARTAGAPAISMHLEDLIGIDTLETIDRDGQHRLYDLQGHEVSGSHRGIIIKNGKKYINK